MYVPISKIHEPHGNHNLSLDIGATTTPPSLYPCLCVGDGVLGSSPGQPIVPKIVINTDLNAAIKAIGITNRSR